MNSKTQVEIEERDLDRRSFNNHDFSHEAMRCTMHNAKHGSWAVDIRHAVRLNCGMYNIIYNDRPISVAQ